MPDIAVTVISPDDIDLGELGLFPLEQYARKMLAQGDSWFSIGHLPAGTTTNLLLDMALPWKTVIVQCGYPGELLRRMTDTITKAKFLAMLKGRLAHEWDAILLSGGGNDLIEAVQAPPGAAPRRRILATAPERGNPARGPARYVSEAGWATFADHLQTVFDIFIAAKAGGINEATPVFLHDYDRATPRDAGAGLGNGPWLLPAMQAFGVPEADWAALSDELMSRLSALLLGLAARHGGVHVVRTWGTLQPAKTTDQGETEDWINEIHPTLVGYRRLDAVWRDTLQAVLPPPHS